MGKTGKSPSQQRAEILHETKSAPADIHGTRVKKGKIEVIADCDGLLKINRFALLVKAVSMEMMIASRHGDFR